VLTSKGRGSVASAQAQNQFWNFFPGVLKHSFPRCQLRWSKSSEQHGWDEQRRGSFGYAQGRLFDSAPQALRYAINCEALRSG
jgi:hypothetical protein